MTAEIDFQPHTEYYTVISDGDGNEIERLDGKVNVRGKDYADLLPIECRYIAVTTELLNVIKIER